MGARVGRVRLSLDLAEGRDIGHQESGLPQACRVLTRRHTTQDRAEERLPEPVGWGDDQDGCGDLGVDAVDSVAVGGTRFGIVVGGHAGSGESGGRARAL